MPLTKARKRAVQIENDVVSRIGLTGDFTNKEVYLLLLDSIDKKIDEQNKKIEQHLKENMALADKYLPEFHKLQEEFILVCKELPAKGFCGKVEKIMGDIYPENDESIPDKVKTLWYDRKILKWVLGASVGALIVSIITLLTRYVFPVN